jgi:hypothetical protein
MSSSPRFPSVDDPASVEKNRQRSLHYALAMVDRPSLSDKQLYGSDVDNDDIDERETRRALPNIMTALADRQTHAGKRTTYHYVESQLVVAIEVTGCYKRAEPLDPSAAADLAALEERIARSAKEELG